MSAERRSGPAPDALDAAVAYLERELEAGPRPVAELVAEAAAAGIAVRTLERARAVLNCRARKVGRSWWIALPAATEGQS